MTFKCPGLLPLLGSLAAARAAGARVAPLTMGNRRETIMRLAKGFFGRRKNCYSLAIRAVEKGLQKAYIGRKLKKRAMRSEWIVQIGAGAREHGLSYAKLIFGMRWADIGVNRKILATLAQQEPYSFRAIVRRQSLASRRLWRPTLDTPRRRARRSTPVARLPREGEGRPRRRPVEARPPAPSRLRPEQGRDLRGGSGRESKGEGGEGGGESTGGGGGGGGGGRGLGAGGWAALPGDLKRAQPSFTRPRRP